MPKKEKENILIDKDLYSLQSNFQQISTHFRIHLSHSLRKFIQTYLQLAIKPLT